MDSLIISFPTSGVETYVFVPPLVALVISFFTSMGGVSGAFLLLPFQMSVLNFTSPSVSSTNFLFNIVAIPSGVYRYIKEGRMAWPLTLVIIIGTLPGVLIGYYLRILYLPDAGTFKLFVGFVLLYIGARLLYGLTAPALPALGGKRKSGESGMKGFDEISKEKSAPLLSSRESKMPPGLPRDAVIRTLSVSLKRIDYEFQGETFSFSTTAMLVLAFVVGVIGGTYGIGGGAIIAPFCVAIFRLPVYTVAGAALMGTFLTSIAGILFYTLIPAKGGLQTSPDWILGLLFGAGGFIGMYFGARCQKYVPQRLIKLLLGLLILFVALKYVIQYFV